MRKWKIYGNFEDEERFLHQMAVEGHVLQNYSCLGVYRFTDGAPQELNYKIDYRTFGSKQEFENYLSLFEDAGWKHVCGTKSSGSQYFLPMGREAGTDIFSDGASAAERYKSLYSMCMMNVAVFVADLVVIFVTHGWSASSFGFLTPGLWQRTGAAFWSGFLFELPFVILRAGGPLFFAVMAVLYGYWGEQARAAYRRQRKENNPA